mmetsp:Transcript_31213/g.99179  ORF Transcript_31213/g.99179 Transcript_31213/m.99179 type:complete len:211 (-) Transcript_31213:959-1591(-)
MRKADIVSRSSPARTSKMPRVASRPVKNPTGPAAPCSRAVSAASTTFTACSRASSTFAACSRASSIFTHSSSASSAFSPLAGAVLGWVAMTISGGGLVAMTTSGPGERLLSTVPLAGHTDVADSLPGLIFENRRRRFFVLLALTCAPPLEGATFRALTFFLVDFLRTRPFCAGASRSVKTIALENSLSSEDMLFPSSSSIEMSWLTDLLR